MLIRKWNTEITNDPASVLASRRWSQPIVGKLEALRDKGAAFVTEQNQHGEGHFCDLRIDGSTLRVEHHRSGPETRDYGAAHLAQVIADLLAGKEVAEPHFNSCVR